MNLGSVVVQQDDLIVFRPVEFRAAIGDAEGIWDLDMKPAREAVEVAVLHDECRCGDVERRVDGLRQWAVVHVDRTQHARSTEVRVTSDVERQQGVALNEADEREWPRSVVRVGVLDPAADSDDRNGWSQALTAHRWRTDRARGPRRLRHPTVRARSSASHSPSIRRRSASSNVWCAAARVNSSTSYSSASRSITT